MSRAIDAYLLNEMQKSEEHVLMFGFSAAIGENGIIIDSLADTQSMNENMAQIFPQEQTALEDYELEKIKEEQDLLDKQMIAAGIGVEDNG